MFGINKLFVAGLTLGAGLLAGCAADNKPAQSSLADTPNGVTCTKCEVTWVKQPSTAGGKQGAITQYSWSKRDACPDCKDAVSNFFTTGKLEHACKTCGDSMKICDTH